jgi:hypothetical protein
MTPLERRVLALEAELRAVRQRLALQPWQIKASGGAVDNSRIVINTGNTLVTGQDGIKFSATPITDVPSAYDPLTPGTAIDGVGWGYLYDGGTSLSVLVVNDAGGGSVVNFDLVGGVDDPDVASVIATRVSLTVGGDPDTTITAYRVDSLIG